MDLALLRAINSVRAPALDALALFLSNWAWYAYPLAFVLAALATRRRAEAAACRDGLLAWALALHLSEDLIKPLVHRPRPTADAAVRATLHVLGRVPPPGSFGFPSGTAATCAAGATWAWVQWGPRAGVPAVVLAVMACWSRLYVGVHYPTDVLAGAVFGVAIAWATARLSRWAGAPRESASS